MKLKSVAIFLCAALLSIGCAVCSAQAGSYVIPSATGGYQVPFITPHIFPLKKGTGAGNYVNGGTAWAVVDSANLAATYTVPVGMVMIIRVSCMAFQSSGSGNVGLWDGGTNLQVKAISTAATTVATAQDMTFLWLIQGDGASHTLQVEYSGGSAGTTIINSSSDHVPTMTVEIFPTL